MISSSVSSSSLFVVRESIILALLSTRLRTYSSSLQLDFFSVNSERRAFASASSLSISYFSCLNNWTCSCRYLSVLSLKDCTYSSSLFSERYFICTSGLFGIASTLAEVKSLILTSKSLNTASNFSEALSYSNSRLKISTGIVKNLY